MSLYLVSIISNANFVSINLFLERIAIDAEQLRRAHLIAAAITQGEFNQRLLNLFEHDIVEAIDFNLRVFLLLKQHLKLTLDQFFQTDGL